MDSEKIRVRDEAAGSVLISERVLSRKSSAGDSSRVCYGRTPQGVPFEWEMQPGTPKNPPKEQYLPPLSPPPAVVSLGLPRPCIGCEDQLKEPRSWLKLKFWKKVKIHKHSHHKGKPQKGPCNDGKAGTDNPGRGHSKVESLEFWSSDLDLAAWRCCSSASSLSTTLSFRNGTNLAESLDHQPRSCAPWNLNALAVYFAKRI